MLINHGLFISLISSVTSQLCEVGGSFTVYSNKQPYMNGCYINDGIDSSSGLGKYETDVTLEFGTSILYSESNGGYIYLMYFVVDKYKDQEIYCQSDFFEEIGGTGTISELGKSIGWDYCFYNYGDKPDLDLDYDELSISCGCLGVNVYNEYYDRIGDEKESSSSSIGIIVGTLGSFFGVILIVGIIVIIKKRRVSKQLIN